MKKGQAMVEFVVALVVILVLVASIIQIGTMGVRHSRLMEEARREAGRKAMQAASSFAGPQFIGACTVGPDGIAFSRDDDVIEGDIGSFSAGIVSYAHISDLDAIRPGSPVSVLAGSPFPQYMFGLVDSERQETINLIPIVRELIYRQDSIVLKGKAWMTWTSGLY